MNPYVLSLLLGGAVAAKKGISYVVIGDYTQIEDLTNAN